MKLKLVAVKFINYALVRWDPFTSLRRHDRDQPISTWREIKSIMRKRFIPYYCTRMMNHKLQYLTQGSMFMDDYHKEIEITMIRVNIYKDPWFDF